MSDVTPPVGGQLPAPPAPPGTAPWQQAPTPLMPSGPVPAAPPASAVPPTYYGFDVSQAVFAGFWRRWWARLVTNVFWSVVCSAGLWVISIGTIFLYDTSPNDAIAWAGVALSLLYGAVVTYLIYSRSLAEHGGTIGMRQMGLRIHRTNSTVNLTREEAFKRTGLALLPLVYWNGLPFIFVFDPSDDVIALLVIIGSALTLLMLLGGLWMLVSERRQTLWDAVGDTVVVVEREPSWIAVVAFCIGLLVPYAAAFTVVVIGVDQLQSEFRRISGVGTFARYLLYSVPGMIVALLAIVIGHIALRSTQWERRRLAGRGLARTATVLGYAFPIGVVLVMAFTVIYRRLNDDIARSCAEERKEIVVAIDSYRRLNDAFPTIEVLSRGIYLDSPDLRERWELDTPRRGSTEPYRLTGVDSCEGT